MKQVIPSIPMQRSSFVCILIHCMRSIIILQKKSICFLQLFATHHSILAWYRNFWHVKIVSGGSQTSTTVAPSLNERFVLALSDPHPKNATQHTLRLMAYYTPMAPVLRAPLPSTITIVLMTQTQYNQASLCYVVNICLSDTDAPCGYGIGM